MPNIDNITLVQEAIRSEEMAKFNMLVWVHDLPSCGTAACIGGFCDVISMGHIPDMGEVPNESETRDFLGIDSITAERLFYAFGCDVGLDEITKDMAIRALEDLKTNNFKTWKDYV